MKKIYQKKAVETALKQCIYGDVLRALSVPLFVIQYDDGDSISSPMGGNSFFQIIIQGNLSIYFTRDDGSTYSLSTGGEGYIIGEVDLFMTNDSVIAEASGPVTAIGVDAVLYREALLDCNEFLRLVASTMAHKISTIMHQDAVYSSLNDRVLNYMRYRCADQTLKGIEKTAFKLHCSARQLQRILNTYTEEGIIEKIGKGTYRIL